MTAKVSKMRTRKGVSWQEASRRGNETNRKKKQKRIEEYELNPSLCSYCEEPLSYEKRKNKFCSHSCSAHANNKGEKRNFRHGGYTQKKCPQCGKETENRQCCSRECRALYVKDRRRRAIKAQGYLDYKKDKWYLIEIRSHRCEVCQNSEWRGGEIPLDVHHKDGDSDNNVLNNLLLICPNCHRQTENHRSRNRKNGRHSKRRAYRRDRYQQGLSY